MVAGEPVWDEVNRVSDELYPGWRDVARLYWATALAGEVGEFCNLVKKLEEGGARARGVTQDDLLEELAVVNIHLQKTVVSLGGTQRSFANAVLRKLDTIRSRERAASKQGIEASAPSRGDRALVVPVEAARFP